jgi:acyl transferase domain-containing protein
LHCVTGTPLGDPIEIGAIGHALKGLSQSSVGIASAKACFGHTEGAAGLTGALLVVQCLNTGALPPIMHLRLMNPYVEAAINDWRKQHHLLAKLPRARLPNMATIDGEKENLSCMGGTSSFGMSGINAHMLLAGKPESRKVCIRTHVFHNTLLTLRKQENNSKDFMFSSSSVIPYMYASQYRLIN